MRAVKRKENFLSSCSISKSIKCQIGHVQRLQYSWKMSSEFLLRSKGRHKNHFARIYYCYWRKMNLIFFIWSWNSSQEEASKREKKMRERAIRRTKWKKNSKRKNAEKDRRRKSSKFERQQLLKGVHNFDELFFYCRHFCITAKSIQIS